MCEVIGHGGTPITVLPFVVAFAVIAVASGAQSLTGFGYALLAVPVLALTIEPRLAVVVASIAGMFLTSGTMIVERSHVQWRVVAVLLAAASAGIPVGLVMLRTLSDTALRLLIAAVALLCTLQVWLGGRNVRVAGSSRFPARLVVAIAGFVSGVLGTSTGTTGPPLIVAFQAMGYEPRRFRATLSAVFSCVGLLALVGFLVVGQITQRAVVFGVGSVPAVVLGWLVGNRLFARIEGDRFRRVVLAALLVSSVVTAIRALRG
jgi:uncharacterized membrane protein YfcA